MYGSRAALDPWSNIVVAYDREEAIGGITMISVNQKKLSVPVLYRCTAMYTDWFMEVHPNQSLVPN